MCAHLHAHTLGLAVEKGYANAQFNLGLLYESGLGVEKSNAEALRLYTLAAEQGDAKVCLSPNLPT